MNKLLRDGSIIPSKILPIDLGCDLPCEGRKPKSIDVLITKLVKHLEELRVLSREILNNIGCSSTFVDWYLRVPTRSHLSVLF